MNDSIILGAIYLEGAFLLIGLGIVIYLINKRVGDKKNETFEDRDN